MIIIFIHVYKTNENRILSNLARSEHKISRVACMLCSQKMTIDVYNFKNSSDALLLWLWGCVGRVSLQGR